MTLKTKFSRSFAATIPILRTISVGTYVIFGAYLVYSPYHCCNDERSFSHRVSETASRLQKESTVRINRNNLRIIQIQYETGKTTIQSVVKCLHVMGSFPFNLIIFNPFQEQICVWHNGRFLWTAIKFHKKVWLNMKYFSVFQFKFIPCK